MPQTIDYQGENQGDWVNHILSEAVQSRVSDVHLEPQQDIFNIRFRIDGMLYLTESLAKPYQETIISRIKVLSQMNITERRFPQDGHFKFDFNGVSYDIRVSTLPTPFGEAAVLRVLNREDILMRLENLGFDANQLEIMKKLIFSSHGLLLTTGPSGSGKSTLLYSILNTLNKPDKNIITLEDPIELQINSIRQTQVDESIDLTFAKVMRSVLRQDPDVVMIGEIRDADTAQMAMQAALTGILVFSTFHTFDLPALVTRFMEMGIPRSVVAQSLTGVISTRLVKKICPSCKEVHQLTDFEKKLLGNMPNIPTFYKGKGCNMCRGSGYLGRIGIFEVVYFDDEVRSYIIEQKPITFLRDLLRNKKMKSLKEAAFEKASQGITTLEEAIRITGYFG